MITVDDAVKIILDSVSPLSSEEIETLQALDRILADDIFANTDIPHFNNSSMDGFAVYAKDIQQASKDNPAKLKIVDTITAGTTHPKQLNEGHAMRIMTGAMIPPGSDTVVMKEDTHTDQDTVNILKNVRKNENIRSKGHSVKAGSRVMSQGDILSPAHIGLLATLGKTKVKVSKKPKVAVIATGNELLDINDKLECGKIRNANSHSLVGQLKKCGTFPTDKGLVKDDMSEIEKAIEDSLDCDVILVSGGVSVGDHDFVKEVFEKRFQAQIKFWKVAVKPGKPLLFGLIQGKPFFGLPGNPVSSMISLEIFVKQAIFKMLGQNNTKPKHAEAILEETLEKQDQRRHFVRAITQWQDSFYVTRSTGSQDSGILPSMVQANSLIIFPEHLRSIPKGSKVKIHFL